ncbi:hypothetical protein HanPI659440_Chr14g0572221 [Helianthus annuus]|nr:hypothetical protein HanPI659440_Chr14g0572221 [Helianthus annuus]
MKQPLSFNKLFFRFYFYVLLFRLLYWVPVSYRSRNEPNRCRPNSRRNAQVILLVIFLKVVLAGQT